MQSLATHSAIVFLLVPCIVPTAATVAADNDQGSLRKRFASYSAKLKPKDLATKKIYAACLLHSGDDKGAIAFIEGELNKVDDPALLTAHYRLLKAADRRVPAGLEASLARVQVRPFAAETMLCRARSFVPTEIFTARDCYLKAIHLNVLDPIPYFELAQEISDAKESRQLCADALLLATPGSDLSAKVLTYLEALKE